MMQKQFKCSSQQNNYNKNPLSFLMGFYLKIGKYLQQNYDQ